MAFAAWGAPRSSMVVLWFVALAGCEEPVEELPSCTSAAVSRCEPWSASPRRYRVETFAFAVHDPATGPSVVAGFDLDCRVSDDDDPDGCYHRDFVSPDGEPGIDNALGAQLEYLIDPPEPPMVMLDVYELTGAAGETCIGVRVVDAATGDRVAQSLGATRTGDSIDVYFRDLRLEVGIRRSGSSVDSPRPFRMHLEGAELSLHERADGAAAVLGGQMDLEELVAAYVETDPEAPSSLVRSVAEGGADLRPDDEGDCQAMSAGMQITASRVE